MKNRYLASLSVLSRFFAGVSLLLFSTSSALAQGGAVMTAPHRLIDVQHYDISAELVPDQSFLEGRAEIRFIPAQDMLSVPFEFNSRMTLLGVTDADGVRYSLSFDDFDSARMRVRGSGPFKAGVETTLVFRFEGTLEREQYAFLDVPQTENAVVHSDGAMLLSDGKWFPVHSLPLDAAQATLKITVPLGFSVVAPGKLESIETVGVNEVFTWVSDQPLTQISVVVARFFRQEFDKTPLPLTFFVTEDFDQDLNPVADVAAEILEYFQNEYGGPPVETLNLVEVGNVVIPSTGSRGLILLESTLFESPTLPLMELAQRIARQWWGYSVRFGSSADAWLQDGFATYAALRFFEVKRADSFETELARQAVQAFKYESTSPISDGLQLGIGSPEYRSIVGSKGGWVLYMLSQLTGRDKLNAMLGEWSRGKGGQTVTSLDFYDFVQEQTGENFQWFFTQWVESVGVPELRISYKVYKLRNGSYKIRGQITQNLDLFRMPMDVRVVTKAMPEEQNLNVRGKGTPFTFETETMPLRVELDPHGKILRDSKQMRVAVSVALGEEYLQRGEFVASIRELEKAKEMEPRSSIAHFRLGEVFFEQHNLSSAANSFRDSLNGDLKPKWVETWSYIYLGKVYDILGQRQRALAEYRKALNTKIDYNGAQAEAEKYRNEPYSRPRNMIG